MAEKQGLVPRNSSCKSLGLVSAKEGQRFPSPRSAAINDGMSAVGPTMSNYKADDREAAKNKKRLMALIKLPGNNVCADCPTKSESPTHHSHARPFFFHSFFLQTHAPNLFLSRSKRMGVNQSGTIYLLSVLWYSPQSWCSHFQGPLPKSRFMER